MYKIIYVVNIILLVALAALWCVGAQNCIPDCENNIESIRGYCADQMSAGSMPCQAPSLPLIDIINASWHYGEV
jgi:hypothetical protein